MKTSDANAPERSDHSPHGNRDSRRTARRLRRLPYTARAGVIHLVHYSSHPGLKFLDPAFFGTGRSNPRDLRGVRKIFCFLRGSVLGGDRGLFCCSFRYHAVVPGRRIYDLMRYPSDPLGYFTLINREAADLRIKQRGYDGVLVRCEDGRRVVLLFRTIPVRPAGRTMRGGR